MHNSIRILGWIEGFSLLALLFIAMPLKYVYHRPEFVRVVGMIHGLLFIGFVTALYQFATEKKWPWKTFFLGFICSVLPFGPFWFDAKYLKR